MLHEINNIGITLQQIELVFYERIYFEKNFKLSSQDMGISGAFIASNPTRGEYCVVLKKSRLTHLTSRPNLFSPFPFRSPYHSGADAFHHKTRRTGTRTRAGLHRSLTTILSRTKIAKHDAST